LTPAAGCPSPQKCIYRDAGIGFGPWISIDALLAPIVGGIGTVFGPMVGAAALLGLGEVTKTLLASLAGGAAPGVDLIVFGALLILSIAFASQGLMGLVRVLRP